MKRMALCLAVIALMAVPVQAAPTLGWWELGAPRTTHQFWGFNEGFVGGFVGDARLVTAEVVINPNPAGVNMLVTVPEPGGWDLENGRFVGYEMWLDITIPNFPNPNQFKEIWVDVGLSRGTVSFLGISAGEDPDSFTFEHLDGPGPSGQADFGFRIFPNPAWETIRIGIVGATCNPAILDYVQIDTICIPAPGGLLLGGIGASLIGWLRRRRTL